MVYIQLDLPVGREWSSEEVEFLESLPKAIAKIVSEHAIKRGISPQAALSELSRAEAKENAKERSHNHAP